MAKKPSTHTIKVAGLTRHLPLFEVAPGVRIAILNILGDTELVQAVARELARQLKNRQPAVALVTPEAKSIPLAYALSVEMNLPYVVLRKTYKAYMGDALSAETMSITTGQPQTLYLDQKDLDLVSNQPVILVDDVISTGSTLNGMRLLMNKAGSQVVDQVAIFTEGDRAKWQEIIALGHLPVFSEGN